MSTSPLTSANESSQSSCSEKTPDSGTLRDNRYRKVCSSPTLRAFASFAESMGQFRYHIAEKIDLIGIEPVELLRTELERLDKKRERIQKDFKSFISDLDTAIKNYEAKKPTDLATEGNSVCAPEKREANCYSLPKIKNTIDGTFTALNNSISNLSVVINKKIRKSMCDDPYSITLEKKLKNLKNMCEFDSKYLEEIGKKIKDGIVENEGVGKLNNKVI